MNQIIIFIAYFILAIIASLHIGIIITLIQKRDRNPNRALLTDTFKHSECQKAKDMMRKNKSVYVYRFIYDVQDNEIKYECGSILDRYAALFYIYVYREYSW